MDTDNILKVLVSALVVLLPVAQIIKDWKFHDKRTRKHHTITRYIIMFWLVVSLTSVLIIYRDNQKIKYLNYQEQVLARNTLVRIDEYLRSYMIDYHRHIDGLINYDSYNHGGPIVPLKTNFPFEKIKNIHNVSLLWNDELGEKNHTEFFKNQDKLLEQIKRCVLLVDLKHYKELSELLLSFIRETELDNPGNNLQSLYTHFKKKGSAPPGDYLMEMIHNKSINVEYPIDLSPYQTNIVRSYLRLYNMINQHIEFYKNYNLIMQKSLDKNFVDTESQHISYM